MSWIQDIRTARATRRALAEQQLAVPALLTSMGDIAREVPDLIARVTLAEHRAAKAEREVERLGRLVMGEFIDEFEEEL